MAKFDIYQDITNRIIKLMKEHGTNWVKPWHATGSGTMPVSINTGKAYNGINVLLLWAEARACNEWGTYKSWQDKGMQVKKGEKGTQIVFFKMLDIKNDSGDVEKQIPMMKYFTVFNGEQIEGYEPKLPATVDAKQRIDAVDAFIDNTGAVIHHGGDSACFIPSRDQIHMPHIEAFTQTEYYYSTLLHELTHWTGHKSRLDRLKLDGAFGSSLYAFEELVAEIGSAMLCATLGIDSEPRADHAKYLNNWMQVLSNDSKAIVKAAKLATQACQYLETLQQTAEAAA